MKAAPLVFFVFTKRERKQHEQTGWPGMLIGKGTMHFEIRDYARAALRFGLDERHLPAYAGRTGRRRQFFCNACVKPLENNSKEYPEKH